MKLVRAARAVAGELVRLTLHPTRVAMLASRLSGPAAYIAGGAAAAVIAGVVVGPVFGTIAEPYVSLGAYLRESLRAGAGSAARTAVFAAFVGMIILIGNRMAVVAPRHLRDDTTTWFGPLPHMNICMLAIVPLVAPAIVYSGLVAVCGVAYSVLAPPKWLAAADFAWPGLCLAAPAGPVYYAVIVGMSLRRLAWIESGTACIHCGYPTRGLPSGPQARCPECGHDPEGDA